MLAPATPVPTLTPPNTPALQLDPSLSLALTVAVIALASLLGAVVIVTVGYSLRAARRRRRRTPMRADLRGELLDRLYGRDEPGWDEWAAALSGAEREELESLLDVYLRALDGSDADRLAGLGEALGINERARREIADGDYWARIHALVWLALLRDAPDRSLLETHCTDTPRERAAAARVLYAAGVGDAATTGIDLLLRDRPSSFSVFGIDTLYRVAETDPQPLFERAAADFDDWEPALQQQVLLAARHLHTVVGSADLSWVVGALSSPDARVRTAAWRALDAYGWNRSIRAAVDLATVADDPDPAVRASAYRMLGAWGDGEAVAALDAAAAVETDDRARVVAAEQLIRHREADALGAGETPPPSLSSLPPSTGAGEPDEPEESDADPFDVAWAWASEHARFDRLARDITGRDRTARELTEGGRTR
nr:HEAT repeat domain-containing protein [Halorubrum salipaludis]